MKITTPDPETGTVCGTCYGINSMDSRFTATIDGLDYTLIDDFLNEDGAEACTLCGKPIADDQSGWAAAEWAITQHEEKE